MAFIRVSPCHRALPPPSVPRLLLIHTTSLLHAHLSLHLALYVLFVASCSADAAEGVAHTAATAETEALAGNVRD
jgi:hypothetical protein